jgi:hypothetical protein
MTMNAERKQGSYKPILLTVLGAGSCFGFFQTFNMNKGSTLSGVFTVAFLLSLLVFVVSVIWLAVKAVIEASKNRAGPQ